MNEYCLQFNNVEDVDDPNDEKKLMPCIYKEIRKLGGSKRAAAHLGLYLQAPEFLARHKLLAVIMLRYCGPHAVPYLKSALRSKYRGEAARSLAYIGPEAKGVESLLLRLVDDDDVFVRRCAIDALKTIAGNERVKDSP